MNTAKRISLVPALMVLVLSTACSPGLPASPPLPTRPPIWQGVIPIGEILAHPDAYLGREVVLVAYYRGWDLFGEIGHGPPLTRSDVAVADATGAIYIAPAGPEALESLPSLRPFDLAATDTLLRLRGRVERSEGGLLYLRVIAGEAVEGLPAGVLLRVRRQGGLAGFDHELMATESGTLYFLDRRIRRYTRFSVDVGEVLRIAEGLPSLSGKAYGTPVPDGFSYELSFWDGDQRRALTFYDPSVEPLPEEAMRILEVIGRWIGEGMRRLTGPVSAAVEALAERLQIPTGEVEVVSYDPEPRNWPDASMGCPEPDKVYPPVITSGYRVFLKARGQLYVPGAEVQGSPSSLSPLAQPMDETLRHAFREVGLANPR